MKLAPRDKLFAREFGYMCGKIYFQHLSSIIFLNYSVTVFLALEQRRISRLKTLQINCRKLGYDMATAGNYSGENMTDAMVWYLLLDRKHHVGLNSVPKTGSTTWRFALYNNSVFPGFHRFEQLENGQKLTLIHLLQTFAKTNTTPAKQMSREELLKCLNTYYVILTVRHPFDRLESTYMDKIVLNNMFSIREKILQKRDLSDRDVNQLAKDGKNIKFEEFLQYIITENEPHWKSIFSMTQPCSVPYRYLKFECSGSNAYNMHHEFGFILLCI